MALWRAWRIDAQEFGWTGNDSVLRVKAAAEAASKASTERRYGPTPPRVKSTRQSPGSIVPNMDPARLAPKVGSTLLFMADGMMDPLLAILVDSQYPRKTLADKAAHTNWTPSTFRRRMQAGYIELVKRCP